MELINQDAVVRYRNTEEAGAYRLLAAGSDQPVAAFAVRMEPGESDLRTLPAARLTEMFGQSKPANQEAASAGTTHVRREFWTLLICIGAAIAIMEMAFAHKTSFAR